SDSAASFAAPVLALATLIVLPSAYFVLLQFIRPFVARDLKPFLEWSFIVSTIAAAIWLVWALFTNADAVLAAMGRAASPTAKPPAMQTSPTIKALLLA